MGSILDMLPEGIKLNLILKPLPMKLFLSNDATNSFIYEMTCYL